MCWLAPRWRWQGTTRGRPSCQSGRPAKRRAPNRHRKPARGRHLSVHGIGQGLQLLEGLGPAQAASARDDQPGVFESCAFFRFHMARRQLDACICREPQSHAFDFARCAGLGGASSGTHPHDAGRFGQRDYGRGLATVNAARYANCPSTLATSTASPAALPPRRCASRAVNSWLYESLPKSTAEGVSFWHVAVSAAR